MPAEADFACAQQRQKLHKTILIFSAVTHSDGFCFILFCSIPSILTHSFIKKKNADPELLNGFHDLLIDCDPWFETQFYSSRPQTPPCLSTTWEAC